MIQNSGFVYKPYRNYIYSEDVDSPSVEGNLNQQAVKWKFSLLSGIRECHPSKNISVPAEKTTYILKS